MISLKKYLSENEVDIESEDLKEALEDLRKTGENFIKIYRLLSPFVDLSEYYKIHAELTDRKRKLDNAINSTKMFREKSFEDCVIKNPEIIKLIKEVVSFLPKKKSKGEKFNELAKFNDEEEK